MKEIDPCKLRPGLIWHHRVHESFMCATIRTVLSIRTPYPLPCWGCHDGIVLRRGPFEAQIGDSRPFRARPTPLSRYNHMIREGKLSVRIYEVVGAYGLHERRAAKWWAEEVRGTIYDFGAFPLLFTKALLGDWLPTVAGWEWANWCTEGVMFAYLKGAGLDPWNKRNCTPFTTEKREAQGKLRDVTDRMTID